MAGKGDSPKSCFSKEFKDNYDSIFWGKERDLTAHPTNLSELDKMTISSPDDLYWATEKRVSLTQDRDNSSQLVEATKQESRDIQKTSVGTQLSN